MAAAIATLPSCSARRLVRSRTFGLGWVAVWLLLLSLQLMQVLGLAHGIAHAGWPPAAESGVQERFNAALFNYIDDDARADTAVDAQLPGRSDSAVKTTEAQHSHGRHHHSCVEYDAAAGTAGVHVDFFVAPPMPGISVLALWQAFASWDAAFVRHFSSRAPPC
jgi:hypothetical protein